MTRDEIITEAANYLLDKIDEDVFHQIAEQVDDAPHTDARDDDHLDMLHSAVLEAITEFGITADELARYQA